jgi:hypothetical protein
MIWVVAFIALTGALASAAWWRGQPEKVLAFCVVLIGLCIMAAIRGDAHGIIAFAVWTIASYLLLNFPAAATLYLLSAFCYTLQLQGGWAVATQVFSNVAGLAGLAAVWYGNPKWRYAGLDLSSPGGWLAVDFDTTASRERPKTPDKGAAP